MEIKTRKPRSDKGTTRENYTRYDCGGITWDAHPDKGCEFYYLCKTCPFEKCYDDLELRERKAFRKEFLVESDI